MVLCRKYNRKIFNFTIKAKKNHRNLKNNCIIVYMCGKSKRFYVPL